jgi:hypothetical protein
LVSRRIDRGKCIEHVFEYRETHRHAVTLAL